MIVFCRWQNMPIFIIFWTFIWCSSPERGFWLIRVFWRVNSTGFLINLMGVMNNSKGFLDNFVRDDLVVLCITTSWVTNVLWMKSDWDVFRRIIIIDPSPVYFVLYGPFHGNAIYDCILCAPCFPIPNGPCGHRVPFRAPPRPHKLRYKKVLLHNMRRLW